MYMYLYEYVCMYLYTYMYIHNQLSLGPVPSISSSGFLIAISRSDPLDQPASEADRRPTSQSRTPSTRKVEGERGSASSRFDLGECALALAFRLKKIIAHLGG